MTRRDEFSAVRFANSRREDFFKTFIAEPSEAGSSIGTLAAVPAAVANLERFEDYGYTGSTPSISQQAPLPKGMLSSIAKSAASFSTRASFAKRFDSSLSPTFQRTLIPEKPSMFDQAFIHTRDLQ